MLELKKEWEAPLVTKESVRMDLLSFMLSCHQTGYVQSHAKEQQS